MATSILVAIKNILKQNKTQWKPLCVYEHYSDGKMVLVRANINTGMLEFKTKKFAEWGGRKINLKVDSQLVLDSLIKEIENK